MHCPGCPQQCSGGAPGTSWTNHGESPPPLPPDLVGVAQGDLGEGGLLEGAGGGGQGGGHRGGQELRGGPGQRGAPGYPTNP